MSELVIHYLNNPEINPLMLSPMLLTVLVIAFPMIFAVAVGFFGFCFPLIFQEAGEVDSSILIICIPFALIGIVSLGIVIRNIWMYVSVCLFGKEIEGIVYGYTSDTVAYNGIAGQVCKLLVHSSQGSRFIMYQLGNTTKPYQINTKIPLKVYKDRFIIIDKHKYDIWEG